MKDNKKIIAIIAGLAVVALVVVFVILPIFGNPYNTSEKARKAFENKEAIACTISQEGEEDMVIRMNKGRTKIFMQQTTKSSMTDETVTDTTVLVDGVMYSWGGTISSDANKGMKMTVEDDMLAEMNAELDEAFKKSDDDEEDDKVTFDCRKAKDSDFELPSNIEFTDINKMFEGLEGLE
jgi:hypothetical protein